MELYDGARYITSETLKLPVPVTALAQLILRAIGGI
jgi:hypothetical protein